MRSAARCAAGSPVLAACRVSVDLIWSRYPSAVRVGTAFSFGWYERAQGDDSSLEVILRRVGEQARDALQSHLVRDEPLEGPGARCEASAARTCRGVR